MKQPIVYIITNKKNGTLYTGVTSNLVQRIYQHKENLLEGFTKSVSEKLNIWIILPNFAV